MKLGELFRYDFYRQCWKMLALLMLTIFACKVSHGLFAGVIVLAGIWGAFSHRVSYALICFALLPFLSIINPMAFGIGGIGMFARLGMPVMTVAMLLSAAQRPGNHSLPIMGLAAYSVVALVSSMGGYAPAVSYFKLINFVFFVLGIYVATKNIDQSARELMTLRAFFFAFGAFIVVGSFMIRYLNPGAAHFGMAYGLDAASGRAIIAAGQAGFLCGVVNHSQCLGPTTACVAGWMLVDMLFVEKQFRIGHIIVICFCPPVMYWTMSRTSLLAFLVGVIIITAYCVPKFKVSPVLKRRLRSMMMTGLGLLILSATLLQLNSGGISKWLTKHAGADADITVDNLTGSRQHLIQASLYDFRQNPMLGKGFQVSYDHQFIKMDGKLVLSAPIEKGFMPTMVLGETGVIGAIFFFVFLLTFYIGCSQRQYYATLALFTSYLASNLGEATFFSPGGTGGPEWIIALAGGFTVDMMVVMQKRQQAAQATASRGVMRVPPWRRG